MLKGNVQRILTLFMTSDTRKYEVHNLAPLGNSDHMTISARVSYSSSMSASIQAPKRKIWLYANMPYVPVGIKETKKKKTPKQTGVH